MLHGPVHWLVPGLGILEQVNSFVSEERLARGVNMYRSMLGLGRVADSGIATAGISEFLLQKNLATWRLVPAGVLDFMNLGLKTYRERAAQGELFCGSFPIEHLFQTRIMEVAG